LSDNVSFEVGYGAGEPNDSSPGDGLFNGDYALLGQLTARNLFGRLDLAFTYVNSYLDTEVSATGITAGLPTATGSIFANVDVDRPTSTNSYNLQANLKLSDNFQIGGWAGFSEVRAIGLGDADVWNYGVTFAFPDLGGEGNLGGIIAGVQPRLTGSTPSIGTVLGRREDPDVGLHLEAFYRVALNDHIDITLGVFWITAPNHDNDNADIVVGTIRTTFRF
jgi:hypothetical protein